MKESYMYYDQGWNARVNGEPYQSARDASIDWRCGWRDCNNAPPEDRELLD